MKELVGINFYFLDEVAAMLQVNERTVRRWIKAGKLEAMKWGGRWLIAESDLEGFTQQYLTTGKGLK